MYFAGLIADEHQISTDDLQHWAEHASWYMVSEYTVPWIAAESPHGLKMGLKWIDSSDEKIASTGWSTLSSWISIRPDTELDLDLFKALMERVQANIHQVPNRVRYTMNGFVIAVGAYIEALNPMAIETAKTIGKVSVNLGGTACKVPFAPDYIRKVMDKGYVGKKEKWPAVNGWVSVCINSSYIGF